MIFIRYNIDNAHPETCAFEVWDKAKGRMGFCGDHAMGQRGHGGPSSRALCGSHFEITRISEKVAAWNVQLEKYKGGK